MTVEPSPSAGPEEALLQSEATAKARAAELAAVMEAVPVMTFIAHDPMCRSISHNRAAREFLRLPEGISDPMSALTDARPAHFRLLRENCEVPPSELPLQVAAATGRDVRGYSLTVEFDDGTRRELFGDAVPLFDESGKVRGAVGTFTDVSHQNRAAEALAESERKLRLATDAAELGIWSWDVVADRVIWENERPYRIFGIDPSEGPINAERFVAEFLHEDDVAAFHAAVTSTLETGRRFYFLGRFRRKTGEIRWIEFTGHPVPDADGKHTHMFGTVTDVSARKAQQLAVERSEARLRQVFASNVVGMIRWDLDRSLILDANEEFFRMTGYTRGDVESGSVNFRRLTPPEWMDRNEGGIRTIREQGFAAPYEKEYFRKDGSRVPLIIAGTRFDDSPSEGISFLIDITERKRAEAVLRQNALLFSTLIEQAPVGVYVVDAEFRLQQVNSVAMPAFANVRPLLGRNFDEVMEILWGPEIGAHCTGIFRHTLKTGERCLSPTFAEERRDLGESRVYDWETQRVALPDGQWGVVCYFTDVTARTRAEIALREAKEAAEVANRAKDRFLAVLSHELRTPLTPVLMTAAAHRLDERIPPEIRSEFGMIERNIALEARLIDDLLDLTRIVNGKLTLRAEPCDVHSLLGLVVEMVRSDALEKQIAIQLELGARRSHLTGDPARLQQVFWNLLRNAVKFTPAGGRISVRSFDGACASGRDDEARICIEVRDSGVGFEPAAAARIFEPFEQAGSGRRFGGIGAGVGDRAGRGRYASRRHPRGERGSRWRRDLHGGPARGVERRGGRNIHRSGHRQQRRTRRRAGRALVPPPGRGP